MAKTDLTVQERFQRFLNAGGDKKERRRRWDSIMKQLGLR